MKKLNLKLDSKALGRDEMKNIAGGSTAFMCTCANGNYTIIIVENMSELGSSASAFCEGGGNIHCDNMGW